GGHYRRSRGESMIVEHFLMTINETNCYVLACSETGEAAIIDPGEWSEETKAFFQRYQFQLKWILLTHGHPDHVGGIEEIKKEFDVPVVAHAECSSVEKAVADGDVIELGALKIKVIATPGHTPDSICFMVGKDLYCGDTLFAGSVGGVPNQKSYQLELKSIREKLLPLGDDMVLYPGHGPATTVFLERLYNPFLLST
ncbi:MAG: MBL fold metallo-hydrolase, partial [bacterium]